MLAYQKGFGLIEVLVALLLLSVAVLGFSAMQMRAIKATDETLVRSDAMVVIRNISEDMRLYPSVCQKHAYASLITASMTPPDATKFNCATVSAEEKQYFQDSYAQISTLASASGIRLGANWCSEARTTNLGKVCLIASWNDTTPEMSASAKACAKADGTYNPGASCFIMETY